MHRSIVAILMLAFSAAESVAAGPYLALGFKVGEVTDRSAIVWTRLTAQPKANPAKLGENPPRSVPDDQIAQLPGAVPGMAGSATLAVSTQPDFANAKTYAARPAAGTDFTHHWQLTDLAPATKYFIRVTAADASNQQTASLEGSFTTAPAATAWLDVKFAIMSCQTHKDRDDNDGMHIYPAMTKQNVNFYVATGDNVYYDSDTPTANTVEMARFHWHRMYALPWLVDFHRTTPGYWEKDDHDCYRNDGWPPQGKNADRSTDLVGELNFHKGLKIFREQNPLGEKTYRTVRWGKGLQVWFTEGRDFRSPNNMPDGPDKTIWGREQMEWVKSSILASDADFKVLVSPTPIVGPDRGNKSDNFSNKAFGHEGTAFRAWTKENKLTNLFTCCGDRHWQYHSVDPVTGLNEFSAGAACDAHAGGSPGLDPEFHKFHRVQGGFITVSVAKNNNQPTITFRHHDVDGKVVYEKAFVNGADRK
jgi:alkaline phosphatase D